MTAVSSMSAMMRMVAPQRVHFPGAGYAATGITEESGDGRLCAIAEKQHKRQLVESHVSTAMANTGAPLQNRGCDELRAAIRMKLLPITLCVFLMASNPGAARSSATASTGTVLQPCVILLHGLARSSSSMKKMSKALTKSGYLVRNTAYPSTDKPVDELASEVIPTALESCAKDGDRTVHFVTHSMGGILIR